MSSIGGAFGWKSEYGELKMLKSGEIKKYKNVVLIVVDGLGYEYLIKKGRGSFLKENLRGEMTSVFLPTTASALTSILTGVAPQQHAFTGWYMNFKEIGVVCNAILFSPRAGGESFSKYKIKFDKILEEESFFSKLKNVKIYSINPVNIRKSDFNLLISKNSKKEYYKKDFFRKIKKVIGIKGRKYVYAYWPFFDEIGHKKGIENKKTLRHFEKFDEDFFKFVNSIKDRDTLFIVTADHGFIDTPLNKIVWIDKHPKIKECLSLPLCGEGRTAYCYVHPSKVKQFEKHVKKEFGKYCWLYKSEELIKKDIFGLFKPNPKLSDRVGDYVLLCKDNYFIKDKLEVKEEEKKIHIGHHGGISRNEMLVPLVVVGHDFYRNL